jgi:hypothetical protein
MSPKLIVGSEVTSIGVWGFGRLIIHHTSDPILLGWMLSMFPHCPYRLG